MTVLAAIEPAACWENAGRRESAEFRPETQQGEFLSQT